MHIDSLWDLILNSLQFIYSIKIKHFIIIALFLGLLFTIHHYHNPSKISQSLGFSYKSSLKYGKKLPFRDKNFKAYHLLGYLLGRNYVHLKLHKVIINTYNELYNINLDYKYIYGETGWKNGHRFWPHRTHQNGLSVDFMIPVKNNKNKRCFMKLNIVNKFGYNIFFDDTGTSKDYSIDFEAMAKHLLILNEKSVESGLKIQRVIFHPSLQKILFKTADGNLLKNALIFSKNPSWVRHDNHYHVDFYINALEKAI